MPDGRPLPRCSFCGKSQEQVVRLIAAPGVYICNECVDLSNEILTEEMYNWRWMRTDQCVPRPWSRPTPLHLLKWEILDNA